MPNHDLSFVVEHKRPKTFCLLSALKHQSRLLLYCCEVDIFWPEFELNFNILSLGMRFSVKLVKVVAAVVFVR